MSTVETMDLITNLESSSPWQSRSNRPRESLPKFARSGECITLQYSTVNCSAVQYECSITVVVLLLKVVHCNFLSFPFAGLAPFHHTYIYSFSVLQRPYILYLKSQANIKLFLLAVSRINAGKIGRQRRIQRRL